MTKKTSLPNIGNLLDGIVDSIELSVARLSVAGVQIDSRLIAPGEIFLACIGHSSDGRDFIPQAINAGAVAVLVEQRDGKKPFRINDGQQVPHIEVKNLADYCSEISGRFYAHPSMAIKLVGVTGTNGKTSCTQLMMQLVNLTGGHCAVAGTLGIGVDGKLSDAPNTTPDAISLQRHLAQWRSQEIDLVAMEVSSHALVQGRVTALQFDVAVFTNLSRDHLDYHGSMQAYGEAKKRLFMQRGLKVAVINRDDSFSKELEKVLDSSVRKLSYSVNQMRGSRNIADVWVENPGYHRGGVSGVLHSPWGDFEFSSPLLAQFNLSNLLAAITTLGALDFSVQDLMAAIPLLHTVAGRMQLVMSEDTLSEGKSSDITVVVDYAHTPDALEQALLAMRLHISGDLWCVFGCGGDRDEGKRPQMGAIVQRLANHAVVTSDNPRHEEPSKIIDEILAGSIVPTLVEVDRSSAIEFAILNAKSADSVLIAGKGHELYQQIGDDKFPFDDVQHVQSALLKRSGAVSDSKDIASGNGVDL